MATMTFSLTPREKKLLDLLVVFNVGGSKGEVIRDALVFYTDSLNQELREKILAILDDVEKL
jgi:hypothetical protein|tara:strand:- start:18 stop:203 length:186 start_codon:yes stop_codon:yes gene_type:complete